MIGIIAAMGGEIERDRQALLPGGEVAAIEGVGVFGRGEAGILPDRPGLIDVHGRVGAAQIGRDARPCLEEVDAGKISLAIGRPHRNALGGEPRLGLAGRSAPVATGSKGTLAKSGIPVTNGVPSIW